MAISKLQPAASEGPSAFAISIETANTAQKVTRTVASGVYTISVSPTTSTAFVEFISGTTYIGNTTTISGSVTFNLGTAADKVFIQSSGASDVVTVNLVASAPVYENISGTLDTITASGTYSQTGLLWVMAIGAGGGAGGGNGGGYIGGSGGGAGGMAIYYGNVAAPTAVTIGAIGTGGSNGASGTAGGTTSFGSLAVATGGAAGRGGSVGNPTDTAGGVGTTGNTLITGGFGGGNNIPAATVNKFLAIKTGTYGGGGRGRHGGSWGESAGAGDGGIGTGGAGGGNNNNGSAATGYGSGGGAGGGNGSGTSNGGNGSPGVIYVLRGF
jgi:hypothetical protein